jgi:hypothetical protein
VNANKLKNNRAIIMLETILLNFPAFSRVVGVFLENKAFETNFYAPLQLTLEDFSRRGVIAVTATLFILRLSFP